MMGIFVIPFDHFMNHFIFQWFFKKKFDVYLILHWPDNEKRAVVQEDDTVLCNARIYLFPFTNFCQNMINDECDFFRFVFQNIIQVDPLAIMPGVFVFQWAITFWAVLHY